jgi:hypothetical protein
VRCLIKNVTHIKADYSLATAIGGQAYLAYNPVVSDADKENMGLPLHDATRTPVPAPTTIPEIELDSSIIRQVTVIV